MTVSSLDQHSIIARFVNRGLSSARTFLVVYQRLINIKNVLGETAISAPLGYFFIPLYNSFHPGSIARLLPTATNLVGESHCESGRVAAVRAAAALAVSEPLRLP